MKKLLRTIGLFILISTVHSTSVQAAADITATLKATTANTITVTVKNNGTAGIDVTGSAYSLVHTTITATNTATTQREYSGEGPILAGGVSRDAVVSGLVPNTEYLIEVSAQEGSTPIQRKILTARTKPSAQQNLPVLPLYVSFVKTETVISTTEITNITIKNTGTKTFNAVLTLKTAGGQVVSTQNRSIGAGQTNNSTAFYTLSSGTGYIITMTGTEENSNRRFATATYEGLVTKNAPTAPPAATAQTTTASAPATLAGSVRTLVNGVCTTVSSDKNQCGDGFDNQTCDGRDYGYGKDMGDHKADHYGVDTITDPVKKIGDGVIDIEPDPSCFSTTATEEKGDDVVSTIIPCTDKCTFTDVFRLLNNFIKFFLTVLLIPIFIILVMYAGFKYITAEGNPSKIANLKKMLGNFALGIIIILCSWLIVRTIMTTVLNDDFKQSGVELLGN